MDGEGRTYIKRRRSSHDRRRTCGLLDEGKFPASGNGDAGREFRHRPPAGRTRRARKAGREGVGIACFRTARRNCTSRTRRASRVLRVPFDRSIGGTTHAEVCRRPRRFASSRPRSPPGARGRDNRPEHAYCATARAASRRPGRHGEQRPVHGSKRRGRVVHRGARRRPRDRQRRHPELGRRRERRRPQYRRRDHDDQRDAGGRESRRDRRNGPLDVRRGRARVRFRAVLEHGELPLRLRLRRVQRVRRVDQRRVRVLHRRTERRPRAWNNHAHRDQHGQPPEQLGLLPEQRPVGSRHTDAVRNAVRRLHDRVDRVGDPDAQREPPHQARDRRHRRQDPRLRRLPPGRELRLPEPDDREDRAVDRRIRSEPHLHDHLRQQRQLERDERRHPGPRSRRHVVRLRHERRHAHHPGSPQPRKRGQLEHRNARSRCHGADGLLHRSRRRDLRKRHQRQLHDPGVGRSRGHRSAGRDRDQRRRMPDDHPLSDDASERRRPVPLQPEHHRVRGNRPLHVLVHGRIAPSRTDAVVERASLRHTDGRRLVLVHRERDRLERVLRKSRLHDLDQRLPDDHAVSGKPSRRSAPVPVQSDPHRVGRHGAVRVFGLQRFPSAGDHTLAHGRPRGNADGRRQLLLHGARHRRERMHEDP